MGRLQVITIVNISIPALNCKPDFKKEISLHLKTREESEVLQRQPKPSVHVLTLQNINDSIDD